MEPSLREHGTTAGSSSRPRSGPRTRGGLPPSSRRRSTFVTSPTKLAQQAAARAVGDRWFFTLEEPLLAPRLG
jgi:hypothetical protein